MILKLLQATIEYFLYYDTKITTKCYRINTLYNYYYLLLFYNCNDLPSNKHFIYDSKIALSCTFKYILYHDTKIATSYIPLNTIYYYYLLFYFCKELLLNRDFIYKIIYNCTQRISEYIDILFEYIDILFEYIDILFEYIDILFEYIDILFEYIDILFEYINILYKHKNTALISDLNLEPTIYNVVMVLQTIKINVPVTF